MIERVNPEIRRKAIRAGLVPLGLGLFALSREYPFQYSVGHFIAAYFYGLFLLGILSLAVWLWNLLDLIGPEPPGGRLCPRCDGSGRLRVHEDQSSN